MFSSFFVRLSLSNFAQKLPNGLQEIFTGYGPTNKRLNFGAVPDHRVWIQGLFSGFVTIGRYGKWYQATALRDAARR